MRFLALVLRHTFRRSLLRTDIPAAVATALAPGIYWLAGTPMPENLPLVISLWLLVTVTAVVILRLLSAPYLIWKYDQNIIKELKDALGNPKARARRAIEGQLTKDRIQALAFLNSHRFANVINNKTIERISDFPEFFEPMSRLRADDPEIGALLDELETAYYRLLAFKRIKAEDNAPDDHPIAAEYGPKFEADYVAACEELNSYLLVKDGSPSPQSPQDTEQRTQPRNRPG